MDLGVVSLPTHPRRSLNLEPSTLAYVALLPAWGGVAWAEGSLKHKTTARRLCCWDFLTPPSVVETQAGGAAVKSKTLRSCITETVPTLGHPLTAWAGCRHSPWLVCPACARHVHRRVCESRGLPPTPVASVPLPSPTGDCSPLP